MANGTFNTGISGGGFPQSALAQATSRMMAPAPSYAQPMGAGITGAQSGALGGQWGDLMRQNQLAGNVNMQRQMAPVAAGMNLNQQQAQSNAALNNANLLNRVSYDNFVATQPQRSFLWNMLGSTFGS